MAKCSAAFPCVAEYHRTLYYYVFVLSTLLGVGHYCLNDTKFAEFRQSIPLSCNTYSNTYTTSIFRMARKELSYMRMGS